MAINWQQMNQQAYLDDVQSGRSRLKGLGYSKKDLTPQELAQYQELVGMRKSVGSKDTDAFRHGLKSATRTANDKFDAFFNTLGPAVAQRQQAEAQQARLDPYAQEGRQAQDQINALLGLRGQDAMQAAYNENPAQQFQRAQMEKALVRNRAATGGLGNEGVSEALTRLNSGLVNQNIQSQIAQLGGISNRGFNAVSGIGQQGQNIGEIEAGRYMDRVGMDKALHDQRIRENAANSGLGKLGMVTSAVGMGANLIPGLSSIGSSIGGMFGGGQGYDPDAVIGMNRDQFNQTYGY